MIRKITITYLFKSLFITFLVFVMLSLSEFGLRLIGFTPGFRNNSTHFKEVDSLVELRGFYADSAGILTVSLEGRELARNGIKNKDMPLHPPKDWHGGIYHLSYYYIELQKKNYHSDFKSFLEILNNLQESDSDFVAAVKVYAQSPINTNGFRSIEFKKFRSKRKSVLLLGDSYTWGHSASNITNSFADILLTKGYIVYNSGIIATDPAQYLQVARVFIPMLKPDFVVVNFFMGNDIQYFNREPRPYVPVFYCTNAGNLISCPDGIYFTNAKEAYNYSLTNLTIPSERSVFNRLCSKSAITSLLWKALDKCGWMDKQLPQYDEYFQNVRALTMEKPFCDVQLAEIKSITERNQATFLLVVIPSPKAKNLIVPQMEQDVLEGFDYYIPPVSKHNYIGHGHYNDSGHKIHAEFIDSLLKNYE